MRLGHDMDFARERLLASGRVALALLAALAVTLAACRHERPAQSVPGDAKAGEIRLEPCPVTAPEGRYAAECGTLVVPESRRSAGSRLLALPVTRILATGEDPGEPVFFLAGGPGQSNLGYVPDAGLLARHDVVLVGYRGVDGSTVLECPEVRRAARGVGEDLLGPESLANLGQAFRRCAERLRAAGVDLDAYTMVDVVGDLEAAREALSYPRVDLLSESYGTRVAQVYAGLHPDRIARSAMIGVNPPGRFVWEPAMKDRLLERYARLCAEDPVCSVRTTDLAETLRRVAHHMPRRWLFLPIDEGKVRVSSAAMLFNRASAALVFDAYLAADHGDASGLVMLSLAADLVVPSLFVWGDLAAKAVSADLDPGRDYAAEMDPPGSILGAPLSKLLWTSAPQWPIRPIPETLRKVHESSVETLLVSGSVDMSTPPAYATEELLPRLVHGHQVVLAEAGHTRDLWDGQPSATRHLLTTFFDTGAVDEAGFRYVPMDFGVSWGLPRLAKVALAAVALVIASLATLSWWLWCWRRRRRRAGPDRESRRPAISTGAG